MLDNTSGFCLQLFHCNILQIFIFDHIYFLTKDEGAFWLATALYRNFSKEIKKKKLLQQEVFLCALHQSP